MVPHPIRSPEVGEVQVGSFSGSVSSSETHGLTETHQVLFVWHSSIFSLSQLHSGPQDDLLPT